MLSRKNRLLLLIIFGALFLRLFGINHGFPFIFHPDEPTAVRSALGVRFFPNPGHFDWPHLYIYLNYGLYMGFAFIRDLITQQGLKDIFINLVPIMWDDNLIFYLITRIFSATLGALTVVPIYLTSKKLFNEKVGIISALVFSILPFHVWHSHYSLIDVPMVFLFSWSLYFASNILLRNKQEDYIKSGLFYGLAASTKYNGALGLISIPLAHLFRVIQDKKERLDSFWGLFSVFVAGLFSIIGFLIGTPYAAIDYETFLKTDGPKGALWQFTNVGSVDFGTHIYKLLDNIVYKISDDLGYTVLIGFFVCLLVTLYRLFTRKYSKFDIRLVFLFIPSLFFIYYISGFGKSRSHYFFVIYPYVTIIFSYLVYEVFLVFHKKYKMRVASFTILAALLFLPAFMSLKNSIIFKNNDTRIDLANWAAKEIQNEPIIYDDNDLKTVLESISTNFHKGFRYIGNYKSGYFIILVDSDYLLKESILRSSTDELYEAYNINNSMRLGPSIKVFKYEKY